MADLRKNKYLSSKTLSQVQIKLGDSYFWKREKLPPEQCLPLKLPATWPSSAATIPNGRWCWRLSVAALSDILSLSFLFFPYLFHFSCSSLICVGLLVASI